MSVNIRAIAARDIRSLTATIGKTRPRIAHKFATALTRLIRRLERLPLSGSELCPSVDGSVMLRFATVTGFRHVVVLHLPLPDGVDVLRVVDGRQDLDRIAAGILP